MNLGDRRALLRSAFRSALRRHGEVNNGQLPTLERAERIMLEIADERPDIGENLDKLYPSRRGVRQLANLCLNDLTGTKLRAEDRA